MVDSTLFPIQAFSSYFSTPNPYKEIKKQLRTTLFTEKEKLHALATNLRKEIERIKNKNLQTDGILKKIHKLFFSTNELEKAEKLFHKIVHIQKRRLDTHLSPQIVAGIAELSDIYSREGLPSLEKKKEALCLTTPSNLKYLITHKGVYICDKKLGTGGSKNAYLIFDVVRGKYRVHLKFKKIEERKKLRHARCEQQAFSLLKGVSEIIQCKEVVPFKGSTSFILEYANGGTLLSRLSKLTPVEKEKIALQVLQGMVKIHACGIIHKDIKPSNILLKKKPDAEEFVVKITDFDLCVPPHPHTLNLQTRKLFAGTRSFMAPELIELPLPSHSRHQSAIFEANTTSLDIYSLGITFYYLFGGKSFAKKGKERDFEQEASSMRQYLEKDSIPFASFILCMVAHNPRDRPTAQEALDYFQASSLTKTVATINTQPV